MTRIALPALLVVALSGAAACAPAAPPPPISPGIGGGPPAASGPAGTAAAGRQDALIEACRREATRVVLYRDRGQQMRMDEGDSRVGVQANIPTLRAETDRLGQQFERDRLAEECVRQYSGSDVPVRLRPTTPGRPTGGGS
jgi:hypothetical protein